ncbi:rCG29827 [Rattus norvegicus]|uniref:RCG29827 n=1 Tax=Rattus norvegicus TaxID=10116 RepID=A6ILZ0_RAT|nr:rCG29827 [Rattus norvegicus]
MTQRGSACTPGHLSSLQALALTNPTDGACLPFISQHSSASTVPTSEDVCSTTCLTPG